MKIFRVLFFSLAAILSLSLLSSGRNPLAQWRGWAEYMRPGMMGGWGTGFFGGILMLVFWVPIIFGLIFLIKWLIQSVK